jgi:hypothetical protein
MPNNRHIYFVFDLSDYFSLLAFSALPIKAGGKALSRFNCHWLQLNISYYIVPDGTDQHNNFRFYRYHVPPGHCSCTLFFCTDLRIIKPCSRNHTNRGLWSGVQILSISIQVFSKNNLLQN